MSCELCKGDLKKGEVNHILDLKSGIIIIKDVPAKICSQCEECFVDTKTAMRLEQIVEDFKRSRAELLIVKYSSKMTKEDEERKKLTGYLNQVNTRLQILDMIEDRLLKMKELAERVVGEDLKEEEIQHINNQVQELVKEVALLDTAPTKYTYKQY